MALRGAVPGAVGVGEGVATLWAFVGEGADDLVVDEVGAREELTGFVADRRGGDGAEGIVSTGITSGGSSTVVLDGSSDGALVGQQVLRTRTDVRDR